MRVRFEAVSKIFQGKSAPVTAVDRLSLEITSGKLIGFLGPSGCGKTTSLNMLAGIYPITSGKILFDEQDVTDLPPQKRGIGMVFQNYALYPHLTVRDNIAFPLVNSPEMKRTLKQELAQRNARLGQTVRFQDYVTERVQEAAALVEIESYMDRKPNELSGGQQQRVAIARAIVKRPSLLLLDEPLSNLDARLRIQTREEIRKIQRKTGITTIFVTHDQEEAMNICDEIAILNKGVLQQYGAPQDVYDHPVNRFVAEFLGSTKINMLRGALCGGSLRLSGCTLRTGIPLPDGPITVGIRPENILTVNESDPGELAAAVQRVTRHGGAITIDTALSDGNTLQLIKDPTCSIKPGDTIKMRIMPAAICLFNDGGEKIWQG